MIYVEHWRSMLMIGLSDFFRHLFATFTQCCCCWLFLKRVSAMILRRSIRFKYAIFWLMRLIFHHICSAMPCNSTWLRFFGQCQLPTHAKWKTGFTFYGHNMKIVGIFSRFLIIYSLCTHISSWNYEFNIYGIIWM